MESSKFYFEGVLLSFWPMSIIYVSKAPKHINSDIQSRITKESISSMPMPEDLLSDDFWLVHREWLLDEIQMNDQVKNP